MPKICQEEKTVSQTPNSISPAAQVFLDTMKRRRSIRRFTDEPVSDAQMRLLLEAAMCAPTGGNQQSWRFVVVRDPATKQQLSEVNPYAKMCPQAPVVFVVCGDETVGWRGTERFPYWIDDACAATENLLLATTALGLGAVWVGMKAFEGWSPADMQKPYGTGDLMLLERHVQQLLGIPSHVRVLCLIPVGYPAEDKEARTQYDPAKVHYERW